METVGAGFDCVAAEPETTTLLRREKGRIHLELCDGVDGWKAAVEIG